MRGAVPKLHQRTEEAFQSGPPRALDGRRLLVGCSPLGQHLDPRLCVAATALECEERRGVGLHA